MWKGLAKRRRCVFLVVFSSVRLRCCQTFSGAVWCTQEQAYRQTGFAYSTQYYIVGSMQNMCLCDDPVLSTWLPGSVAEVSEVHCHESTRDCVAVYFSTAGCVLIALPSSFRPLTVDALPCNTHSCWRQRYPVTSLTVT
jgi:hypothetical protein